MAKWARAYPAAPISPAPGKVTIHATTIFSPQIQRTACEPRVAPTPKTAPPIACVVEIGTFAGVARPIVVAAAISGTDPFRGRTSQSHRNPNSRVRRGAYREIKTELKGQHIYCAIFGGWRGEAGGTDRTSPLFQPIHQISNCPIYPSSGPRAFGIWVSCFSTTQLL
jgi:hypothetical protein